MSRIAYHDLKTTIVGILKHYCDNYIFIKPTYYLLAKKYLDRLHKIKEGDQVNHGVLKTVFNIYTSLVRNGSEDLATAIGLALAKQLNIDECDFLKYRESKIWTQRYIQGLGLFEAQVYRKSNNDNKVIPDIDIDPVYNTYNRLNNHMELSKLVSECEAELIPG